MKCCNRFGGRPLGSWLVLMTLLCCVVGCGPQHELAEVKGTVSYQGKPVQDGRIVFEVSGYRSAYGQITDGQIVNVSTLEPNDGVPVGEARVAINAAAAAEPATAASSDAGGEAPGGPSGMTLPKNLLPAKYANPATSELTATIQSGENELNFELQ